MTLASQIRQLCQKGHISTFEIACKIYRTKEPNAAQTAYVRAARQRIGVGGQRACDVEWKKNARYLAYQRAYQAKRRRAHA